MNYIAAFKELMDKTPRYATWGRDNINSPYGNFIMESKNSYMCFDVIRLEDCYYCFKVYDSKTSVDLSFCEKCELCYDCIDCYSCFNIQYCQDCSESYDLQYCYDCKGCKNCFGCVGLRHKEYCIFNETLTRETYYAKVKALQRDLSHVLLRFEELQKNTPRIYMHERNTEHCFGDYITNCKNIYYGFDVTQNVEDGWYLYECLEKLQDCCDCYWVGGYHGGGLMYESVCVGECYNCNFILISRTSRDCEFMYECINCDHCFMCAYIRNKKYHILNAPYSREEYEKKVAEIKTYLKSRNMYNLDLLMDVGCRG